MTSRDSPPTRLSRLESHDAELWQSAEPSIPRIVVTRLARVEALREANRLSEADALLVAGWADLGALDVQLDEAACMALRDYAKAMRGAGHSEEAERAFAYLADVASPFGDGKLALSLVGLQTDTLAELRHYEQAISLIDSVMERVLQVYGPRSTSAYAFRFKRIQCAFMESDASDMDGSQELYTDIEELLDDLISSKLEAIGTYFWSCVLEARLLARLDRPDEAAEVLRRLLVMNHENLSSEGVRSDIEGFISDYERRS